MSSAQLGSLAWPASRLGTGADPDGRELLHRIRWPFLPPMKARKEIVPHPGGVVWRAGLRILLRDSKPAVKQVKPAERPRQAPWHLKREAGKRSFVSSNTKWVSSSKSKENVSCGRGDKHGHEHGHGYGRTAESVSDDSWACLIRQPLHSLLLPLSSD